MFECVDLCFQSFRLKKNLNDQLTKQFTNTFRGDVDFLSSWSVSSEVDRTYCGPFCYDESSLLVVIEQKSYTDVSSTNGTRPSFVLCCVASSEARKSSSLTVAFKDWTMKLDPYFLEVSPSRDTKIFHKVEVRSSAIETASGGKFCLEQIRSDFNVSSR